MIGWVALSMTWVELTVGSLRSRLDALYPGEFLPPRKHGTFVIDGPIEQVQFMIQSTITDANGTFMLTSIPRPYRDVSDFAGHIDDRGLRDLAAAQKAWLSVELIDRPARSDDAYRFIGKVLAELAPPDAAILIHPSALACRRFDDGVRRALANGGLFD
jgi:hypothetical protein